MEGEPLYKLLNISIKLCKSRRECMENNGCKIECIERILTSNLSWVLGSKAPSIVRKAIEDCIKSGGGVCKLENLWNHMMKSISDMSECDNPQCDNPTSVMRAIICLYARNLINGKYSNHREAEKKALEKIIEKCGVLNTIYSIIQIAFMSSI